LAGLIGCVTGLSWRIGATSFILAFPVLRHRAGAA
jgi:hypothetical protein